MPQGHVALDLAALVLADILCGYPIVQITEAIVNGISIVTEIRWKVTLLFEHLEKGFFITNIGTSQPV